MTSCACLIMILFPCIAAPLRCALYATHHLCCCRVAVLLCCCTAQLFCQDQLLLRCASSPSLSRPVAQCLLPQLLRVAKREETLRVQLWGAGAHQEGVGRGR